MENKFLIVLVAILIVLVGIGGYYAYGSYRTTQMDSYMLQSNVLIDQLSAKCDETNSIANTTPIDYDKLNKGIDDQIGLQKRIIAVESTAYQYADGPYKDLISIAIQKDNTYLDYLGLWKQRVAYIQQNNYYQASQTIQQEDSTLSEMNKLDNQYKTFKDTHLDIKEHCIKYWNSTDT